MSALLAPVVMTSPASATLRTASMSTAPEFVPVVVMSSPAVVMTSCPASISTSPPVVVTAWLMTTSLVTPVALSVTVPVVAVTPDSPSTTVIVPAASSVIMPAPSWSNWMTLMASVSLIRMPPDVVLSTSRLSTSMSMLPPEPTPVTASMTSRPLAASTSSPPMPPPSMTAPAMDVMVTAVSVVRVVIRRLRVKSTSASMSIIPLPALITAPSVMKTSAVFPAFSASIVIVPLVDVMSPAAPNRMSSVVESPSSDRIVTVPVALLIGESICTPDSEPSPVPVIVTGAAFVALMASVMPAASSTPSPAVPPPAVVPVTLMAAADDAI